jgi:hypothetical protein
LNCKSVGRVGVTAFRAQIIGRELWLFEWFRVNISGKTSWIPVFLKRDVVVEAKFRFGSRPSNQTTSRYSSSTLSSTNNLDSLLSGSRCNLGFFTFSIFPLLYGFQTPPIRIATIGRILKILCPMHFYHLQYHLLRVTIWRSITLPYTSVSDPALRARTRRADERISDADNSIASHSRIVVGCLVHVWTHGGVRPASPARRRRTYRELTLFPEPHHTARYFLHGTKSLLSLSFL